MDWAVLPSFMRHAICSRADGCNPNPRWRFACCDAPPKQKRSAMDVSVRVTTKGTANYDKPCELQNSVKQQNFECILCFWLPLKASLIQCVLLPNDMVWACCLPELVCQRMLRADVLNACVLCVASRRHKCM